MTDPVCKKCNDIHIILSESEGRHYMCTACPVPCQKCRQDGYGPYCEHTPCDCECHKKGSMDSSVQKTNNVVIETCDSGHKHGRILEGEYQGCPVCLRQGMNRARDEVDRLNDSLDRVSQKKEHYKEETIRLAMELPMSTAMDKLKKLEADLKAAQELIDEFNRHGAVRYYREKMETLQGEVATLETHKETAEGLLKRSLAFAFNEEYVNQVELLLWGPCDHDFGGKCPLCYPQLRK